MGILQKTDTIGKPAAKRRLLPVLFLALFGVATLTQLFSPTVNAAIDPVQDRGQYANAATLYYGFVDCLKGGSQKRSTLWGYKDGALSDYFKASHAVSGDWFAQDSTAGTMYGVASYLDGNPHNTNKGSYGKSVCNDILKKGSQAWGFASPLDILCDANIPRNQGGSCQRDDGDGFKLQNVDGSTDRIAAAIRNKAFGGSEPKLTGVHNYLIYYNAFTKGCGAQAMDTGSGDRNYTGVKVVGDSGTITSTRFEADPKDKKVYVYANSTTSSVRQTCSEIASAINQYADTYAESVKKQGPDQSINPEDEDGEFVEANTCGIDSGWFICPIVETTAKITDGLYDGIISMFVRVPPISTDTSDSNGMYQAWKSFRNIANVAFIIVFMIIIYSQVTSAGISNYGVKKMLPRLIIAALLVNVSYWVSAIAVDLSNIAGASISEFLGAVDARMSIQEVPGWADLATLILSAGAVGAAAVAGAAGIVMAPELALSLIGLVAPLMIGALLAILAAVIILILRQAAIVILVILSPLAFVAMLLPNTEKWFTKWRQWFFSFLLLYPAVAVLFGGAQIAGQVLANAQTSGLATLLAYAAALFVTAAPLFLIPFMVRQYGGNGIDKLGAKIQSKASGLGKWAGKPFDSMRQNSMKRAGANLRRRSFEKVSDTDKNGKSIERFRRSGGVGRFIRYSERRKAEQEGQESEAARAGKNYITDKLAEDKDFQQKVAGGAAADTASRNRVLARALTEQDKADDEEVANAEIILLTQNLSGQQRLELAKDGRTQVLKKDANGSLVVKKDANGNNMVDAEGKPIYDTEEFSADESMRKASIDAVFNQGSASQKEEILALSGGSLSDHHIRIGKHLAKMAGSDPALGGQTIDEGATGMIKNQADLDFARARGVTQGRVDAKKFAEMSPSSLNLTFNSIYRNLAKAEASGDQDKIALAKKAEAMFKEAAYGAAADPRLNQAFNGNDDRKEIVEKLDFGGSEVLKQIKINKDAPKGATKTPWVGKFNSIQEQKVQEYGSKSSSGGSADSGSKSSSDQQLNINHSNASGPNVNQSDQQRSTQNQQPPVQQQPTQNQQSAPAQTRGQVRDSGLVVPPTTTYSSKAPAPSSDTWAGSAYRGADQSRGPAGPPPIQNNNPPTSGANPAAPNNNPPDQGGN